MSSGCESIFSTIDLSLFLWPKYGVGHDDSEHKVQLELELKKVREACQGLGFFRVINHGIDPTLIQTMDSISRDMFGLPAAMKERAIFHVLNSHSGNGQINLNPGYHRPGTGPEGKYPLPENMSFPSHPLVDQIASMLWPQGNQELCERIHEYMSEMRELSHGILKLIIASLGLDVSKYYLSSPFDNCEGRLRMNLYHNYNSTAANEQIFYKPHTDIGCLTILYQDHVGGLQVRTKEGDQWIDCEPLPGTFVVNIADCLQMWSNGRYRSAEHRVVHGGGSKRLSLAFFLSFSDETEIGAPEELIDDQNPPRYRAVKFRDLKAYRWQTAGPFLGQHTAHYEIHSYSPVNKIQEDNCAQTSRVGIKFEGQGPISL